jgi:hypothetical protein
MVQVGRVLQQLIHQQFEVSPETHRLRRHTIQLIDTVANTNANAIKINKVLNTGISVLTLWQRMLSSPADQWPLMLCTAAAHSVCQSRAERIVWNAGLRSISEYLNQYSKQRLFPSIKRGLRDKSCAK